MLALLQFRQVSLPYLVVAVVASLPLSSHCHAGHCWYVLPNRCLGAPAPWERMPCATWSTGVNGLLQSWSASCGCANRVPVWSAQRYSIGNMGTLLILVQPFGSSESSQHCANANWSTRSSLAWLHEEGSTTKSTCICNKTVYHTTVFYRETIIKRSTWEWCLGSLTSHLCGKIKWTRPSLAHIFPTSVYSFQTQLPSSASGASTLGESKLRSNKSAWSSACLIATSKAASQISSSSPQF